MHKAGTFLMRVALPLAALALALCIAGCEAPPENKCGPCSRPKVLAFTASWCVPCQRAKPMLVQIQAAGVDVEVIDIDARPDLAAKYSVTNVPTFFVVVCGKSTVRTQDIAVVVQCFPWIRLP
jgi:thiol-disulfide isomerase/thioredoxin